MASIKLSFIASQKRYTKMVKGERWYSTRGLTDSDADKRKAMFQFLEWIGEQESIPKSVRTGFNPDLGTTWQDQLTEGYKAAFPKATPKATPKPKGDTFQELTEQFLDFKSDTVSKGQMVVLRSHFNFFTHVVGNRTVKTFDLDSWDLFHRDLRQNIKSGKWSPKYANSVLSSVRGFFSWLAVRVNQAPPHFVNAPMYSIKVPVRQVKPFTHDEIQTIMDAATPIQKLYYLLMMNTGMTQQDVSDLSPEMIDWKKGTLTRKRGKHDHQTSHDIPEVKYHLWDCTFKLLKKFGNRKGETVFTNEAGGPLVGDNRNDSIAAGFKILREKTGIKKTLKVFRKSGTSALGTSTQYKIWREIYLANTGSTVTDRHYDGTTELPKEVTDYIEEYLEVCKTI